ncbi:MAG: cytochrome c oxidase subunit II [Tepidisphaeraceae bacterium]|jgi:cytochrome c oxidase subunit 2
MNAMLNNLASGAWGGFWMPPEGSAMAGEVDWLFFFIYWICVFFFLLVLVLLVAFAWKYRYREGQPMLDAPKHNTALELTWTFIPTLIVIVIFFYGFKGYMHLAVPPPDAYEVDVTARMWSYSFRYPNGEQSNELHIPVNTPVVFVLSSDDVIHGFYLPLFRVKKDIVPGRYNKIWVQATSLGTSDIFCTQYCGQDHSSMRNHVVVESRADFVEWLGKLGGGGLPPVERGKYLWETRGCQQCHSTDGAATGKAPTWKDLFMTQVQTTDGMHMADEDYLHEVITHPNVHPIAGFQPIMPPTEGLLNEKDVGDIIAYIKSISKNYHPALPAATGPSK